MENSFFLGLVKSAAGQEAIFIYTVTSLYRLNNAETWTEMLIICFHKLLGMVQWKCTATGDANPGILFAIFVYFRCILRACSF